MKYFFSTLLFVLVASPIFAQSCPEQGTTLFPGLTGQELLSQLVTTYKPASTPSYNTAREIMYGDIDNYDGYVYGIYTGYKAPIDPDGDNPRTQANSVNINAEHTWPQSKGATEGTPAHSDMNHLRPAFSSANSARGNIPFAEIPDNETITWYLGTTTTSTPIADSLDEYSERRSDPVSWEPREEYKGDIARGMFYFYTMYKSQADEADPEFFDIQKEYLRSWNTIDSVSAEEYARACAIMEYQDDKVNPFVIDPTLVERAFFEGTAIQTTVQFALSEASISEDEGIFEIEVTLANPNPDTATTVDVVLGTGTAEAGVDFETFTTQTLTFPAGSSTPQTFSITVIDDEEEESAETIQFLLQNIEGPEQAVIGSESQLQISIQDNDGEITASASVWINELHYDNYSTDEGEFIEIAVRTGFVDLSDLTVSLYNGSGGAVYDSFSGTELTSGSTEEGVSFYYMDFPANGIQNGSPDGISLDLGGEVIQFISYEGTLTASDGPAEGMTSTDIGVEQTSSTPAGSSLSLTGKGTQYEDFTWTVTENNATKGAVNLDQEIESTSSGVEEPIIFVSLNGSQLDSGAVIDFGKILVGSSTSQTIQIKNLGNAELSLTSISTTGQGFSNTAAASTSLAFEEIVDVEITFGPTQAGEVQGTINIESNADNTPVFSLTLTGEGVDGSGIIPISEARTLPLGTRVTVAGRVTVGNEFGGPLYMQDATAGIAVFWEPLHSTAQIGDSVTVSGPLTVFNPIGGADSDFLLQISETETDDDITYEIHDVPAKMVSPRVVTLAQVNSGNFEGQLVQIQNATINHTGAFQGNTNYTISDNNDEAELRIDNSTNLVGALSPSGPTNVVAVVGKFNGIYQLLPRSTSDLDTEEVTFPGDSISKDLTFEVATWNIEWFGNASDGPEDDELQFQNVKTLITTLDADVYALQEISNPDMFAALDEELEEYEGVLAGFDQVQKTAYLYKTSTIESLETDLVTTGMVTSDWANGRFPFYFRFNATINGVEKEFNVFNIHAKAFGESSDYTQRVNASTQLKSYLDVFHEDDNVIVLGDFNDEILQSTNEGNASPYQNFDLDEEYTIVTKSLEEAGYTSYSSNSMIDHIIISSELTDEYFEGTERVENPNYIGSFLSQTSDHYPVWVRFEWGELVDNETETEIAVGFHLEQNYPNPFNPSTVINYQVPSNGLVTLEVFDLTGRIVATLVNRVMPAGEHQAVFDASGLSSGVYMYRLVAGNQVLTRKMMLIK